MFFPPINYIGTVIEEKGMSLMDIEAEVSLKGKRKYKHVSNILILILVMYPYTDVC